MPVTRAELVADYCRDIKNANTEDAKKEIFITFLTRLFGAHDKFDIIGQFGQGAERPIHNISRVGKNSTLGRADTQYGNVIIEFEKDLARTGAHAEEQLKDYLSGNCNSGIQGRFTLIATDCLCWKVYTLDYDSLFGLGHVAADKLHLRLVEEFNVTPDKADAFYFFLDRFLFGYEPVPATLDNILIRFGHDSDIFQAALKFLHEAYSKIKDTPEIMVARSQWEKFLRIAYGKFDASGIIFLIQSYLSVLAKMLAYEVITGKSFIDDNEIGQIMSGAAFRRLNVENFTDNDFFRWTALDNASLTRAFRIVADGLSQLDFTHVGEDILKGVYQELVDEDTRHALGEHYTPDWLCAKVVARMNPRAGQKILDPSCGSGSFLKAVANHLGAQQPDISASELNACLYGIDVHPLSVQITKATLLMAYGKKLAAEPKPVFLNVFLANSLLLPEEDATLMGNTYEVAVDDSPISIPDSLFTNRGLFAQVVQAAEMLAEGDFISGNNHDSKDLKNIFQNRLALTHAPGVQAAIELYRALLKAKRRSRDGIWAYILANTFAPIALKNQFDMVIGNPPWLVFRDIVANDYQEQIRKLARRLGVMPTAETLFTHLELAAIFVGYCLSYFLKPQGKLAFVLPRSVFVADQHHKMREGGIMHLRILELWDLARVEPLFNVPSCVMFAEKGNRREPRVTAIPGKAISGRLPCRNADGDTAEAALKMADATFYFCTLNQRNAWSATKVNMTGILHYKDKFRQGATLVPRSLCFVDVDQTLSGGVRGRRLMVKSARAIYRDAKEPWKSISMEGTVHGKYLFATALANNIVPFGLNGYFLVALPIKTEKGIELLTPEDIEQEGEIESANWFQLAGQKWDKYKTERNGDVSFSEYLNWQNKLVQQNLNKRYIVSFTRSGTNAASAVIDRNDFEIPFIVNNAVHFCVTDSYHEALYLSSFFNSCVPNSLIKPFQTQGLFGARDIYNKILEIPLPAFDPGNRIHMKLANLAQIAAQKVKTFLAAQNLDSQGGNMDARETGRFRNRVREQIAAEMVEIDARVSSLLS